MKKRGLFITIIIVFLGIVCVLEQILVSNTLGTLKEKTDDIQIALNQDIDINLDEIYQKTYDLSIFWKNNENLLCFFINHKDMRDMGIEINKMLSYSKSNTKEEFIISFNLVVYYTDTFNHIMGLSLQNLI